MGIGQGTIRLVKGKLIVVLATEYFNKDSVGDGGGAALNGHCAAVYQDRAGRIAAYDNAVGEVVSGDGQDSRDSIVSGGDEFRVGHPSDSEKSAALPDKGS